MLFEVYRSSDPYSDARYVTAAPCEGAVATPLVDGSYIWCVKVDTIDELLALGGKYSVIIGKHSQHAPHVSGRVEIYDDYRE